MYYVTTATKKIAALTKRIKAVQGGTSAGKTIGIEQVLIDACQAEDGPGDITSIVSESFPHLKRGAIRDFLAILQTQDYYDDNRWNRSDFIYTFETGAQLEFFSADQPGKTRGPRRKRLFINEANNIPFEAFEQLEVRTSKEIYLDWNPTNEFWFYTDVLGVRNDVEHLVLTYKDNEALDPAIVASIEQRKNRKGWWQVYGLGQLGEVEGKIYKDWQIIDEVPHEARLKCAALDFGYSNDPTAIVLIYCYNGGYIFDEVCFQKGLSNKQIADILLNCQAPFVIADSAEPKSIDEIKSYGVLIMGAEKGKDSVVHGIQLVQEQRISVTKRSVNVIKEFRNYLWMTDRDGKILNEPEHQFSHSMDAIRYGMTVLIKKPQYEKVSSYTPKLREFKKSAPPSPLPSSISEERLRGGMVKSL
jgi:phage terminase large subunit